MKNFTKQNFKTNPLWIRILIMAFMLLAGTSSAWAAGFWDDNAWNIKFYSPSQGKDIWINDNYDAGHGKGSTIDLGTFSSAPYLKGYWAKTWGYGNKTDKFVKITFNNSTTNDGVSKQWDSNGDQMWKSESLDIKFPDSEGLHEESITFTINGAETMTCKIKYKIEPPCASCCGSDIFRVAGSSNLCGTNWDGNDDNNKMICSNDIFSKSYDITANTSYTFKIVKNNSNWINTIYSNASITNKIALKTTGVDNNVTLSSNPTSNGKLTIYYDPNNGIYATFEQSCNTPTAGNFTYTAPTDLVYDGSEKTAEVSWDETQGGSITVKYSSSSTEFNEATPTNVGTYYVYVTTTEANGMCGVTDLYIGKSFNITKADQTDDFEITNEKTTYCGFPSEAITLTATGGSTNETVTYESSDKTVATISGSKLTVSKEGSVTITATRPGGDNYNNITATKQFTFYKAPDTPTALVTNVKLCNSDYTDGKIQITNYVETNTYTISPSEGITGDARNSYTIPEDKQGDYTITVKRTIDGCEMSNSTTISVGLTDNTAIKNDIIISAAENPICYGASTTLTCTEISGATYLWSTDATTNVLNTGNLTQVTEFSVKISKTGDEGCQTTKNATFIVNVNGDISEPTLSESSTSICSGSNLDLTSFAPNGTVWYEEQVCSTPLVSTTVSPQTNKTYYAKTKDGNCYSSQYSEFTINVTTTPVITGVTVTTPNKPVTLTSSVENTVWSCTGGSLSSNEGKTVDFTASSTGEYIITAKNKDNENCSASVTVYVRESLYYIYIRRPKNGETDTNYDAYELWYEYSNDDQKGGASWFEEGEAGSDIGSNDAEGKNDPNYGGYAPEFSFEDCNDYIWDAFAPANLTTNYKFHIHAPNGSGSSGHATFTKTTTISSMTSDLYYKIKKWDGSSQGVQLTQVTGNNIPTPRPEVATPIISMEPIICSGTNATVEITNPQNGVTYTLTYNGETQGDPISYNGSNEVKFSVNQAGTYIVNAETTEGTCKGSATSRGENLQIITTTVSFSQSEYTTTPWIPVTVKINVPKGYSYTYTDTDITSITPAENAPIKKVNGTEITYTFPRPNAEGTVDPWGIGNTTGDGWGEKTYQVKATIIGAPDACNSATATVKLQDEGNDKCTTTNP